MCINKHITIKGKIGVIDWTHIVIHHSWSKDTHLDNWEMIRKYHTSYNGWKQIGYHFGLEKVGNMYEIKIGRPIDMSGAHTKGWNDKALGICLVGNYDKDSPNEEQMKLLICLINTLRQTFIIPVNNILGHRECYEYEGKKPEKSCPGWSLSLLKLRERLMSV